MMTSANETVGLALFGLGRIGRVHLNIIISNRRANLLWVVEENEKFANEVLGKLGLIGKCNIVQTSKISQVLDDSSVKGVYICSPTDTHTALVRQCLKAGKTVFCEKPLSENLSDIIACYDDAEKYGSTLMCGFNRHFDPAIRTLYNNVMSGVFGKLYVVKSTFRDRPLWIGAHGLSQTFLIHDADLITWFAGELPETVVCQASANIKEVAENDDVDTVVATMKFPSGLIGILDFCRYSPYGYDIRLEVSGSEGMQIADVKLQTSVKTYGLDGRHDSPISASFDDRFYEAYTAELSHFLDVIQGKVELEVKRENSERVAIVIDAIQESYKTGKIVHLSKSK